MPPKPRIAKREGLDRESIVEAAIDLLDQVGLDGLTTRRLAAELGIQSPALYWHFRNKQQLLDAVSEKIQLSDEFGPPRDRESWQTWVRRRAHQRRRVLLAHRDGARLVAATYPGASVMRLFDKELAALVRRGFTPVEAFRAITSIGNYITGFVLEEQAERLRPVDTGDSPPEELDAGQLADVLVNPTIAAAIVGADDPGRDNAFEFGLRMLIDGMAATLERSEAARQRRAQRRRSPSPPDAEHG